MTANNEFALGAAHKESLVRECQEIVFRWAEPKPGQTVKAQIRNSANRLGKPYGMVRRAWFRLGGPKVLAQLREAEAALIAREAAELKRAKREWEARLARLEQRIVDPPADPKVSHGNHTVRRRVA
jgi:hypothetical protein